MLKELNIKNYALIEDLSIKLDAGFICMTGETGSGKSILLGALSLLLGKDLIQVFLRTRITNALLKEYLK